MDNELKAILERKGCERLSREKFKEKEQARSQMLQRFWKHNARKDKKMANFAKGVNLKSVKTKYGEILKVGIKLEEFANNPINDRGYINFDILRAKETNKPYAALDDYKKDDKQTDEVMHFEEEMEMPF